MEIEKIAVLGAGLMGHGIAQVCAQAGFDVAMRYVENEFVRRGLDMIRKSLERMVSSGKTTKERADSAMEKIKGTTSLEEAVVNADMVIEAIPEDLEAKKKLWSEVDRLCSEKTIFATNTSTLSITEMTAATRRQEKFIGMHWFNPPQIMRLIEIIQGVHTSPATVEVVKGLAGKLGKEYIIVKDTPGFAVNRILVPMLNEAVWALYEGVASIEDIDKGLKLGANHPIGPLQLADYIGLDTLLHAVEHLRRELGDKYKACPLLKMMVKAGNLGVKTGKGFYDYARK